MRHAIKNTSRLAFSDSCKNVNARSVVRGSVLPRNAVTRSSAKLALNLLGVCVCVTLCVVELSGFVLFPVDVTGSNFNQLNKSHSVVITSVI